MRTEVYYQEFQCEINPRSLNIKQLEYDKSVSDWIRGAIASLMVGKMRSLPEHMGKEIAKVEAQVEPPLKEKFDLSFN